jgi:hypothetical protein
MMMMMMCVPVVGIDVNVVDVWFEERMAFELNVLPRDARSGYAVDVRLCLLVDDGPSFQLRSLSIQMPRQNYQYKCQDRYIINQINCCRVWVIEGLGFRV